MKPRAFLVTLVLIVAFVMAGTAQVRKARPSIGTAGGTAHVRTAAPLPIDLQGTLDGIPYMIKVPANWNGTLLVFAHGTQLGAPTPVVAPPPVAAYLLAQGYALAGSGFRNSNQEGVIQTHALTTFFRDAVANPRRIIVWGASLGAGITLNLIEKYPGIYDGAIGVCSPSAGAVEAMDSALAFSLAFDAAFGWPEQSWGPIGDVRDDVVVPDVLPLLKQLAIPANRPKWEFIRLVMHLPPDAFWTLDPGAGFTFFMLQMWKATVLRAATEREYGGPVAENIGMHYTVDADDATLALSGLTREQVDTMLAHVNERANITANRAARAHLAHWGAPTGALKRPVLTMHHKDDGMAFVTAESYYKELVETAGAEHNLVQTYVEGAPIGHCNFTQDQFASAVAAMESWLDGGVRPGASFFPAAKGFNFAFVPGPWIF